MVVFSNAEKKSKPILALIWFLNFVGCSVEIIQPALEICRQRRGSQSLFNRPQQVEDSKKDLAEDNTKLRQATQQKSGQGELDCHRSAHPSVENILQQVEAPESFIGH